MDTAILEEIARNIATINIRIEDMKKERDNAYFERNILVSVLAQLAWQFGYPVGTKLTDIPGWSSEWHNCVYIDLPSGQVSWHYHTDDKQLFETLPPYTKEWDGHTTVEKYKRLMRLPFAVTHLS